MDQLSNDKDFWAQLVPELSVQNLEQSLQFYRNTLGFTEKLARPEDGFSYLEMGQVQIMLEQIPDDPNDMWQTAPLEAPLGRGINFQIEVENVGLLHDKAVSANYEIFEVIGTAWYREGQHENGQTQFLIQDPDGYLLRFMQHLGKRPFEHP